MKSSAGSTTGTKSKVSFSGSSNELRSFFRNTLSMHIIPVIFALGFVVAIHRNAKMTDNGSTVSHTELIEIRTASKPATESFMTAMLFRSFSAANASHVLTVYKASVLVARIIR